MCGGLAFVHEVAYQELQAQAHSEAPYWALCVVHLAPVSWSRWLHELQRCEGEAPQLHPAQL